MASVIEEWRPVVGYEGYYSVSNLGRVRSEARTIMRSNGKKQSFKERILKSRLLNSGYLKVPLNRDGVKVDFTIHRLIAKAFCDKPDGKDIVNHIDGCRTNNSASNLEWCTQGENNKLAITIGNKGLKIDGLSAYLIRDMYAIYKISYKSLAALFDCSISTIYLVIHKKRWVDA